MARKVKAKINGPRHKAFRLAADVCETIEFVAKRTGWPERKVVENFMRTADACMRGNGAAARTLVDLLNAAAATQAAKAKAEGLASVARKTEAQASERLRKLTNEKPAPPVRQAS